MKDLTLGDIVRLKSGGPEMTIEDYSYFSTNSKVNPGYFQCTWFDAQNNYFKRTFRQDSLLFIK